MHVLLQLKPEQVGKGRERKKINIVILLRFDPTRNRKLQKNSKKIQKIKKSHFGLILSQNSVEKNEKERKIGRAHV